MASSQPRVLKSLAALAIALTVLSGVAALFYFTKRIAAARWVEHTMLVQNSAHKLFATLVDAETGQRGYLLTADKAYLEPYHAASSSLERVWQTLKTITTDNLAQQSKLREIEKLIPEKMGELARTISTFDNGKRQEAEADVRSDAGKATMDKIRKLLDTFQAEEQHLLIGRSAEADRTSSWLLTFMSLSLLTALGLAAALSQLLRRSLDRMTKARDEFAEANIALEKTLEYGASELSLSKVEIERESRRGAMAETRQQLAVEAADLGTWDLDLTTGASTRTLRHDQIFGYENGTDEWTYDDFLKHVHPEDLVKTQSLLADATKNMAPWNFETRIVRVSDEQVRWIEVHGQPRFDNTETLAGYLGVVSDITDRKQREEYMEFVTRELAHRSKNMLAVIQAISRQTAKSEKSLPEFETSFNARLEALSKSQDLLLGQQWRGADLKELIVGQIEMFGHEERLDVQGRPLFLKPEAAQNFSLAIHELTTNAVKYGAFSVAGGRVKVKWSIIDKNVDFSWEENGGPPVVVPLRKGFGNFVTGKMIAQTLNGTVNTEYPASGLRWKLVFPADTFA
jgi:PAS domain S-box-containing protein